MDINNNIVVGCFTCPPPPVPAAALSDISVAAQTEGRDPMKVVYCLRL
jgi:hypothetical protein